MNPLPEEYAYDLAIIRETSQQIIKDFNLRTKGGLSNIHTPEDLLRQTSDWTKVQKKLNQMEWLQQRGILRGLLDHQDQLLLDTLTRMQELHR